jgi:hypothetical protein
VRDRRQCARQTTGLHTEAGLSARAAVGRGRECGVRDRRQCARQTTGLHTEAGLCARAAVGRGRECGVRDRRQCAALAPRGKVFRGRCKDEKAHVKRREMCCLFVFAFHLPANTKMAANIGVVKHVLPQKDSSRFAINTSCTTAQNREFRRVLFGFSGPSPQLLATLTAVCGS